MAPAIQLAEYWTGIHDGFSAKFSAIQKAITHPISGAAPEHQFRQLFADYLPRRYRVEPGFVANSQGLRSPLMDLLIVDCENIPPLYLESQQSVFATEAVVGAIEITAAPSSEKFRQDLRKLAKVRAMGGLRKYRQAIGYVKKGKITYERMGTVWKTPGPRAFLITCGHEWEKADTYQANLIAALQAIKAEGHNVWLHGAFSVRHGLLAFAAHSDFECEWITKNALLEFVFRVNMAVASLQTGQIDLHRYRPSAPPVAEEQ